MSASVKTFWCEREPLVRVSLRRYSRSAEKTCTAEGRSYCNAQHVIHEQAPDADWPCGEYPELFPHDDPRWPTTCEACGREFGPDDHFQVFVRDLYSGAPDGKLYTLQDVPPGAMWDATWIRQSSRYRPPDGITLVVKLPNGMEWMPDGPAANSDNLPGWTRTGDPRKANLTATPSIGSPWPPSSPRYYHGWLRNGELVEC